MRLFPVGLALRFALGDAVHGPNGRYRRHERGMAEHKKSGKTNKDETNPVGRRWRIRGEGEGGGGGSSDG